MIRHILLLLSAASLLSATELVFNGAFASSCNGWSGSGLSCAIVTGPSGQSGNPSPFAVLNGNAGVLVYMNQTISGLTVGTEYTLSWDMQSAYRKYGSSTIAGAGAEIDGNLWEYIVPNTQKTWTHYTTTFTYAGGSSVLRFTGQRNHTDTDVAIDNVSLQETVPEPSTLVLAAAGLAIALHRRIRIGAATV